MTQQQSVEVAQIFDSSQKHAGTHRKNAVQLRKLMAASVKKAGDLKLFSKAFLQCLNRLVGIKKKDPVVERCIKFVASFIAFLQEKGNCCELDFELMISRYIDAATQASEESIEAKFTNFYLGHLLRGLEAKDKTVRYRCCQLLALSIDSIEEMDDEMYEAIRVQLLERVRDKEASVRVQAAIALSKFQASPEDQQEEVDEVTETLIILMRTDPSPDVRKAVLCNLDISKSTIPFIIERIRDVDARIRKYVYRKSLTAIGDFRVFSIADREQILAWGLNDREPTVKKACIDMLISNWISQCGQNIVEFLMRVDVMNSEIASQVLMAFFERHPGANFKFDEMFWENLIPETAFMASSYFEFMSKNKDFDEYPELSRHAARIQSYFNKLAQEEDEEAVASLEFICNQLLKIASVLDFADEAGRRNLLNLLRTMLVTRSISDSHMQNVAELMKKLTSNTPEFLGEMLALVKELLADSAKTGGDEVDGLARDISQLDIGSCAAENKLKALGIVSVTLQNTTQSISTFLLEFLQSCVVPAITDASGEPEVQIAGLYCFIQYSLANLDIARQNFPVLLNIIDNEDSSEVEEMALKALFDLILLYGIEPFVTESLSQKKIINKLGAFIENYDKMDMQTTAIEGFAKVLALKPSPSPKILQALVTFYFDPHSGACHRARQCLTYFFHFYTATSAEHREQIAKTFGETFHDLVELQEDEEDATLIVPPLQIAMQFIEWILPRESNDQIDQNYNLYVEAAITLCKNALGKPTATIKLCTQVISRLPLDYPTSLPLLEDYVEVLEDLGSSIRDRSTLQAIERIKSAVQNVMVQSGPQTPVDGQSENEQGDEEGTRKSDDED